MKKLTGLTLILFISLFTMQATAQGKASSKKVEKEKVKTEKTTIAKPEADAEVAKPTPKIKTNESGTVKPAPRPKTNDAGTVKPAPQPIKEDVAIVKPAPRPKTKTDTHSQEVVQPAKGPSRAKRMHAEERSKGHAFSGKGKGGDKNLVNPTNKNKEKQKKIKKSKKNKKKKIG